MCTILKKVLRAYGSHSHSFPSAMRLSDRNGSINIDLECRQYGKEMKHALSRHVARETWFVKH